MKLFHEAFKNNHGLKLFFMEANFCATKLLYQGIEPMNYLLSNSSILLSSDSIGFDLNVISFDVSIISFDVNLLGVWNLQQRVYDCLSVSKIAQNIKILNLISNI